MRSATRHQKSRRHNASLEHPRDGEPPETDHGDHDGLDGLDDPLHVPISDVMTRNVVCVPAHVSVTALEELLLDRDLSGAPVVDGHGKLVGFVTMTDLVRELHQRADTDEVTADRPLRWGFHEEPEPRTVAQVMTPTAAQLPASCPVAEAVSLMAAQKIHRVPIVSDDGALLGIVTASDIVRYLARDGHAASRAPARPDAGSNARPGAPHTHLTEADRLASLGFVIGGVAHQINNALTPMRLSLGRLTSFELSRRPLSEERFHRIELLQDVREGVARIEQIIRELKAFSHTDGPSRSVHVTGLLEVAIGLATHEIRHRARLVCDYAPVPPVRARPAELRQVFLSLLVNAAQAIQAGEAHINEIRVLTRTDDHGRAVIEIKDTGAGIPSGVATRIFEPFFTTKPDGKGLGLGLTVSRDIVSALGGEITIDSAMGRGTTVRVALPPGTEDTMSPLPPAEAGLGRATLATRRRILILDDDRPVAAALALELGAHDVVVAESGREALEILRHDKGFDVILCDLMMPEISGMDVYEALRLIDPALLSRVVLMTGGAFTPRARQFLAEVDAPMIEKPFYPGQLHAVVSALEHPRGPADARSPAPETDPWRSEGTPPRKGL